MRELRGRVAVVTGAASGIGRALAEALAAEGMQLALADLDREGLAQTAAGLGGARATTHRVDVARPSELEELAAAVSREHGGAHLLVNNAGVASQGDFHELSAADFDHVLATNLGGVVHGVRAFLPQLRAQPAAHIVNLSSVFGLLGVRGQSAYCASKFAVRGFTEALRAELEGSAVGVSVVLPGGVATPIAERARRARGVDEARARKLDQDFRRAARTSPRAAAARIVRGVRRGEPRILVGPDAWLLDLLHRLLPSAYRGLLARLDL